MQNTFPCMKLRDGNLTNGLKLCADPCCCYNNTTPVKRPLPNLSWLYTCNLRITVCTKLILCYRKVDVFLFPYNYVIFNTVYILQHSSCCSLVIHWTMIYLLSLIWSNTEQWFIYCRFAVHLLVCCSFELDMGDSACYNQRPIPGTHLILLRTRKSTHWHHTSVFIVILI